MWRLFNDPVTLGFREFYLSNALNCAGDHLVKPFDPCVKLVGDVDSVLTLQLRNWYSGDVELKLLEG